MSPDGWVRRWSEGATSAEDVVARWRATTGVVTPWMPHEPFRCAVTAADPTSEPRDAIAEAVRAGAVDLIAEGPVAFLGATDGTLGIAFDHGEIAAIPVSITDPACDDALRAAIVGGWSRRAARHRLEDRRVRDAIALLGVVAGLDPTLSDGGELTLTWPSRTWDRTSDAQFRDDRPREVLHADDEIGCLARRVVRWGRMTGSTWSGSPRPVMGCVTSRVSVRRTVSAVARAEQRRRIQHVIGGKPSKS